MSLTKPPNRMDGSFFASSADVTAGLSVGKFIRVAGILKEVVSSGEDETINGNKLRNVAYGNISIRSKNSDYTAVANDKAALIRGLATLTLTLTDPTILGDGWFVDVLSSSGIITVIASGGTVDGATSITIPQGQSTRITCDGSAFFSNGLVKSNADNEVLTNALTPVLAGGSGNAYTLTAADTITAYVAGQTFKIIINSDNTGASTLNVDGLGNVSIKKRDSSNALVDLASSDFLTGKTHILDYDGSQFVVSSPVSPSDTDVSSLQGRATTLESSSSDHESRIAVLEATTGSGIDTYASAAAGLLATASGVYFYVPSAVTGQAVICYLNSSGSAVVQYILASFDAIATSDFYSDVQYAIDADGDLIGILMKDASGAALLAKADDGLRMVLSQKTIDAIGYDSAVSQVDGEVGRVLMRDGAANSLLVQRPTGIDMQPSDQLAYRLGEAGVTGALTQLSTTLSGRVAIKYSARIQDTPFVDDYVYFPASSTAANALSILSTSTLEAEIMWGIGQSNMYGQPSGASAWVNGSPLEAMQLVGLTKNSGAATVNYKGPKDGSLDTGLSVSEISTAVINAGVTRSPFAQFAESLNWNRRKLGLTTYASIGMSMGVPGISLENIIGDAGGGGGTTVVRVNVDTFLAYAKGAINGYGMTARAGPLPMIETVANNSDTESANTALMTTLWADYKAKLVASGMTNTPLLVLTQGAGAVDTTTANWDNRISQHKFALANNDVILAGPLYCHKVDEPSSLGAYTVHHSWPVLQDIGDVMAHAVAMHEAGYDWTIGRPVISGTGTTRRATFPMMGNERLTTIGDNRYAAGGISNGGLEVSGSFSITKVEIGSDYLDLTFNADPAGATLSLADQSQDTTLLADTYSGFRSEYCTTYHIPSPRGVTTLRRFIPTFRETL